MTTKLFWCFVGFVGGICLTAILFLCFAFAAYAFGVTPANKGPVFAVIMAGVQGVCVFLPIGGAIQGWRYGEAKMGGALPR